MVINLKTTKVTMITLKQPHFSYHDEKKADECEVVATSVSIQIDPKDMKELEMYHLSSAQGVMDGVETTQVDVYPL
jgi:hypothetical protein